MISGAEGRISDRIWRTRVGDPILAMRVQPVAIGCSALVRQSFVAAAPPSEDIHIVSYVTIERFQFANCTFSLLKNVSSLFKLFNSFYNALF